MDDKGLIFISYAQSDEASARQLRERLQVWGWRTWMDVYDIPSEGHRPKEIENGLKAADQVVAVMTPAAVRSESVLNEWEYAIVHGKPLTAVRIEACELPPNLTPLTPIDFIDPLDEKWSALESTLNDPEAATQARVDPYLPYLQRLYKRLNTNLAQKVINRKDGNDLLPNPLHLRSSGTPEDVDVLFTKQDRLNPLFEADNLEKETAKQDYNDFESAFRYYEGQVLLLGEPGSGKTITLLQFARDAVVRRIQDPTQRLPMFAILPDWLKLGTPEIWDWMAEMPDAPEDAARLVREGRALLLFDGLDELGESAKELDPLDMYKLVVFDPRVRFMLMTRKVVRNPDYDDIQGANNQIVVTSRLREYRRTGIKIGLKGAVILKKLDQAQITMYLQDVPGLQAIFQNDQGMLRIAETPLLLSLIAYAFREKSSELQELRNLQDGALRDAIFNAYVSQRYAHEQNKLQTQSGELPFELSDLMRDLGWIAMVNAAHQSFASENVLFEADFWRTVGSSKSRTLITFCQQLNLITEINATTWRFVHLKLRDTLAYGRAAKILKGPRTNLQSFSLAGTSIINIKDRRILSELLTKEDDRNRLLRSSYLSAFRSIAEAIDRPRVFDRFPDLTQKTSPSKEIDPARLQELIAILDSPSADKRIHAVEALGRIRDQRAIEALIKSLNDPDFSVQHQAVNGLGALRAEQAIDSLVIILHRNNFGLRRAAVEALGRIGVLDVKVVDNL